ncbi:MAG: hypothetical protein JNL10_07160 [Verrucomicrobiales bacterium]|nr:hypothetical protein [Verrucomicrobiales bacterium]
MKTHHLLLLVTLLGRGTLLAEASTPAAPYSAHEWGTFTSVQGSDGIPIAWKPFVKSDLPEFVYTRRHPFSEATIAPRRRGFELMELKSTGAWLQRMETPVIYFHSEQPLSVRVRVELPQGLITEWYPRAGHFGPVFGVDPVMPDSDESFLEWPAVSVSPVGPRSMVGITDRVRGRGDSHYYAARSAHANEVRIAADSNGPAELESFLFYRGAGNFGTPLRVSMPSPQVLLLENVGRQPLDGLRILEGRGAQARQVAVPVLNPGESRRIAWQGVTDGAARAEVTQELSKGLQHDLTQAGLNEDEAAAMIDTWRESWFGEDGLRVFFLLPRDWTDATLPLHLNPPPRELVRVLVGRAEVITVSEERDARASFAIYRRSRDSRDLMKVFGSGNPRFRESLLTRIGVIESRWEATAEAFRCSLPNPAEATGNRLREDLEAARTVLADLDVKAASKAASNTTPPIPSDSASGILQPVAVLTRTPE